MAEEKMKPDASLSSHEPAEGGRDVIERELKRQDQAARGSSAAKAPEADKVEPKSVMDRTKGLP